LDEHRLAIRVHQSELTLLISSEGESGFLIDRGVGESLENLLERRLTDGVLRNVEIVLLAFNHGEDASDGLILLGSPESVIASVLL